MKKQNSKKPISKSKVSVASKSTKANRANKKYSKPQLKRLETLGIQVWGDFGSMPPPP